MGSRGAAPPAHEFGRDDHVCWAYRRPAELVDGVVAFLEEGLAQGLQVVYMADRPETELRDELAAIDDRDGLIASGALGVRSLAYERGQGGGVDSSEQLTAYTHATATAVASGYSGLRVAVDVTPLVGTPAEREAFGRWEQVADRFMVDNPFSALCAYDIGAIGDDVADEMACLHPVSWGAEPAFHLHATPVADVALSGEVDAFTLDRFTLALDRTVPALPGEDLRVDVRGLTFIDHRGLLALARHGRRQGARQVVLVQPPPVVDCVLDLVEVPLVRVEPR